MASISEKHVFLWAVIIFFILVIVLFYITKERRHEYKKFAQPIVSGSSLPLPSSQPSQQPFLNNAVRVEEDSGIHTAVRYEDKLFIPKNITIANESGCFVEIQNKSDEIVIPRLGPYDSKEEKGFLYSSIAAHARSLIDPRYGVATQVSFYNKNNLSAIFIVHIDPTCL